MKSKNIKGKEKEESNNKSVDLNPNISVIILKISRLIKRQRLSLNLYYTHKKNTMHVSKQKNSKYKNG